MDPNNMTGDPNHKRPPSVFRFDPYPFQNSFINHWDQAVAMEPFTNIRPQFATSSSTPFLPVPSSSTMFSEQSQHLPSSFSFGTQRPLENVVQFPFTMANNSSEKKLFTQVRTKRKTDSPPLQACKQHITEEKMAEHLSNLHISSNSTPESESKSSKTKRLYMCEEMRNIQANSLLPPCLLKQMQEPCTALVLWRPPARLLPSFLENNQPDMGNNNEESTEDNNPSKSVISEYEMPPAVGVEPINNMEMDA